jgi:hypothetical protein
VQNARPTLGRVGIRNLGSRYPHTGARVQQQQQAGVERVNIHQLEYAAVVDESNKGEQYWCARLSDIESDSREIYDSRMQRPHRTVRIRFEHRIEYSDPIQVEAGDRVNVGPEDAEFPGWKWCKASDGREGWVPVELLSGEGADAIMLQDYSARELAVRSEEEVTVEEARHDWLLVRNSRGERGWIPASNTDPL